MPNGPQDSRGFSDSALEGASHICLRFLLLPMIRRLQNESDAREILDQFNGFHDGFIRQVSLRSHDSFEKHGPGETEITHRLTGTFDAVIQIAHYNYSGLQPLDRVIQCSFKGVREFCLDLRELMSYEWNINSVDIQPLRSSGDGKEGFSLVFAWSKLVGDQWSEQKQQILTFVEAEFEESG